MIETQISVTEKYNTNVTTEQEQIIEYTLKTNTDNSIITTTFNLNITKKDINTLTNNNWLNDQIINFYLNLIAEDNTNKPNLPKIHIMNFFFVPMLKTLGYNTVKRWTRKIDIFTNNLIIIPVHKNNNHWTLATIDLNNRI
ncbi:sentrin-specific protease 1-like [Hermetia illucens]|uniref:sentrin-specific protease 1-like n=1 Tax=Hermetia illucens TaxID=343691 RepID=UPI0018CC5CC3|nr:sentrin-specific protease 1-like [Hermetia illucens]